MTRNELSSLIQENLHTDEVNATRLANAIYDAIGDVTTYPMLATKQDLNDLKMNLIDRIDQAKSKVGAWLAIGFTAMGLLIAIVGFKH